MELQGEIAVVLQASWYWTTDCSLNNILHRGYSKDKGLEELQNCQDRTTTLQWFADTGARASVYLATYANSYSATIK